MRVVRPLRAFARALPVMVWGAAALLVGCHSSSTSPPGTPVVTMSDLTNSSDFSSYIVAIDGITLTASDGSLVTPLTTAEVVDLVSSNTMTEVVEAPAVPSGTYISASVTVDYSSPQIWVNVNGQPVAAAVEDPTGAAVGADSVTVTFDPAHPLVITAGQSIRMQFDVDVAATSSVVRDSPATVQVVPFVTARVAPVDSTVMRARGLFVVVPTGSSIPAGTSGTFIMNMRPFYDLVSELGAVFVNTNAQTYWNVNGVAYTGTAGLNALAPLQESTPIVAYGTLDNLSGITPTFNATSVYVGASQESPLAEYLTGVVSVRGGTGGNTIVLAGANYLTPTGVQSFVASTPVTIGPNTIISEDGVVNPNLTLASVSTGQKVQVSGQAAVDDITGQLLGLDATSGQVRLQSSSVWGTPTAVGAGSVTLDVFSLGNQVGGFAPSAFDFTGTGTSASEKADPQAYAVNTGSLDTSGIVAGTTVLASGNIAPFASAPPDFNATAITPGSSTLQTLVVEWTNGGSAAPFTSNTPAGLRVNLSDPNLGSYHYIGTGPAQLDLKTLPESPLITTVGADQSNLDLAVGNFLLSTGVSEFSSASAFATAVFHTLNGTNKVFRLVAYGQYNASSNTFVASRIHLNLQSATTS